MSPGPVEEWIFYDHPSGRNCIYATLEGGEFEAVQRGGKSRREVKTVRVVARTGGVPAPHDCDREQQSATDPASSERTLQ